MTSVALGLVISLSAWAFDISWARMTAHTPVEASPIIVEQNGDARILAVNRGGQVMTWGLDGSDSGAGEGGAVAQLPKGTWSSSPVRASIDSGAHTIICSTEGLLVCLDDDFSVLWQHQLSDATTFGAAIPVSIKGLKDGSAFGWIIGDHSGAITRLDGAGNVVWQTQLGHGPCKAPVSVFETEDGNDRILAASGSHLCCLQGDGSILWSRELPGQINSRTERFAADGKDFIVCGAGAGVLVALSLDGDVLWQASVGDEIGSTIALLPRPSAAPLILCRGLWRNLYAVDSSGNRVWTHQYRAKSRGCPVVLDADNDGDFEVLITTYHQHVYLLDDDGLLIDDLRLAGCINGTPLRVPNSSDVVVATASLLAHRLHPSPPRSLYGATRMPENIAVAWPQAGTQDVQSVLVHNPHGALLCTNLICRSGDVTSIRGYVGSRSTFELPLSKPTESDASFDLTIVGADSKPVYQDTWGADRVEGEVAAAPPLDAWPTLPYGAFDESRISRSTHDNEQQVRVRSVYGGETEAGAFVVASSLDASCRLRASITRPLTSDGKPFGGDIDLYEVVATGTVNGERAHDALTTLGNSGLLTVAPRLACKVWVNIRSGTSEPGTYTGKITLQPLHGEAEPMALDLVIEIIDVSLPERLPLELCTWDYIPNTWFPAHTKDVLDGMAEHGVTIFPRSTCSPSATVDNLGHLAIDWTSLDIELDRLSGRGQVLFQIQHPPITFASPVADDVKRRFEIEYLHQWRDHLKTRGWDYSDYALYPVDEPGLGYGGSVDALVDAGALFREADPRLRVYTDPVPSLSLADFNRIEPFIDVWCPNMRMVTAELVNDPRMRRILDSGKEVWSYECVSQVKSLSPLCYNRANAWRAAFFGLKGIGVWTFSTTDVDHWFAGKSVQDEYALVYPGEKPVSSVRWEAVRDGLEDVAALKLLEDAVASRRSDDRFSSLVAEADEAMQIAKADIMEISDMAYVESRDYLKAGDRAIPHTWTDALLYRRHRDRIASLTLALAAKGAL